MLAARIFYAIYFGGVFGILFLEFVYFLFSAHFLRQKISIFLIGIIYALIWPLALLAPQGRDHFGQILNFIVRRKNNRTIEVKKVQPKSKE